MPIFLVDYRGCGKRRHEIVDAKDEVAAAIKLQIIDATFQILGVLRLTEEED